MPYGGIYWKEGRPAGRRQPTKGDPPWTYTSCGPGTASTGSLKTPGVPESRIIADNGLTSSTNLVPGQTLVIQYPGRVHTVSGGETLRSIAERYGVTINQLLRNNPQLGGLPAIYPGQTLVIDYNQPKQGEMSVNGYAYPYIDREVLRRTLPYLTYITLFTYGFTPEGNLIDLDDEEVIRIAREYGVAPLMLISTLTEEGTFSNPARPARCSIIPKPRTG